MAADSTDLKAAYLVEVNKISNTLDKAEATYLLDRWIDALDAQAALEAGGLQSYSIAGRSFTKANISAGKTACDELRAKLNALIYGSESLMDMNTEVAEPYARELN